MKQKSQCWACQAPTSWMQLKCYRCDRWQGWLKWISIFDSNFITVVSFAAAITISLFGYLKIFVFPERQGLEIDLLSIDEGLAYVSYRNASKSNVKVNPIITCGISGREIVREPEVLDENLALASEIAIVEYQFRELIGQKASPTFPLIHAGDVYQVVYERVRAYETNKLPAFRDLSDKFQSGRCYLRADNGFLPSIDVTSKDSRATVDFFDMNIDQSISVLLLTTLMRAGFLPQRYSPVEHEIRLSRGTEMPELSPRMNGAGDLGRGPLNSMPQSDIKLDLPTLKNSEDIRLEQKLESLIKEIENTK